MIYHIHMAYFTFLYMFITLARGNPTACVVVFLPPLIAHMTGMLVSGGLKLFKKPAGSRQSAIAEMNCYR